MRKIIKNNQPLFLSHFKNESMKIGIVCYPTFGGSGVMATELGLALAHKGHQVHFITYNRPVRLSEFNANIFFHEVRIPNYALFEFPPYESALSGTLVDVVKAYGLDILHVHYAIPHASSAYFAQKMLEIEGIHIPYVTTLHGTDITLVGQELNYKPVVEFAINQSNAVTAVSDNLKASTLERFAIQQEIDVIYNFVDHNRFRVLEKKIDTSIIAPKGEKIIVHVSNFRKVKRVDDVVRMFKILHQTIPAKLLLVGDGPERSKIEDMCRCEVCKNDVIFLGKQEKLEDIYNLSDLFVLPSESESFGLAALEAMACGLPIISSNAGGIPEVNIHGETGYLSNVGDYEDMAKNAVALLKDVKTYENMKQNAILQSQKFSIDKIVPQYEKVYERLLVTKSN